jgi:hypothetical protein
MGITLTKQEEEAVKNLLLDMATAIPPLNVVAGIKDITSTGWDLYRQNYKTREEETGLKLQLILGIICLVPGAGAPVRTTFRQLIRNPDFYGPLMFEIITRLIEKVNILLVAKKFSPIPMNPEAFLMQLIDVGRLERELENARKAALTSAKESMFGRWFDVSGTINTCFDFLKRNLADCLRLLSHYVRNAITKSKRRSNNSGAQQIQPKASPQPKNLPPNHPAAKSHPSPPPRSNKPKTNGGKENNRPSKHTTSGKMAEQVKAKEPKRWKAFGGGVGEHIADYYCLEKLGWGKGNWIAHDKHTAGSWKPDAKERKLNERGKLKKLTIIGNDKGIDSFWQANPATNGGKPYAVIEAKGSFTALGTDSQIAKRLGVLSEKEDGRHVVQMSHVWIQERINDLFKKGQLPTSVQVDFQKIIDRSKWKVLYRRHIIYTALNIPDTVGWQHADALLNGYEETKHRNHNDISVRHIDNERHIDRIIAIRRRYARNKEKRHNQSKSTNRPGGRK